MISVKVLEVIIKQLCRDVNVFQKKLSLLTFTDLNSNYGTKLLSIERFRSELFNTISFKGKYLT